MKTEEYNLKEEIKEEVAKQCYNSKFNYIEEQDKEVFYKWEYGKCSNAMLSNLTEISRLINNLH